MTGMRWQWYGRMPVQSRTRSSRCSLRPGGLRAFQVSDQRARRSEAFIALLENSQVERLFDATTQQDFPGRFRGAETHDRA
jgi:hypothetical protein